MPGIYARTLVESDPLLRSYAVNLEDPHLDGGLSTLVVLETLLSSGPDFTAMQKSGRQ